MTRPLDTGQGPAMLVSAGKTVSAAEALELVRSLATQVDTLHAAGRIHRSITPYAVSWDGSSPAGVSAPELHCVLGEEPVSPEWLPPELRALTPLELPSDLDAARHTLRAAGTSLDPRQIDVYQLGALLCRLLTGDSADAYRRSPRVKGKVPAELRLVLERALGSDGQSRYADAAGLIGALDGVRWSAEVAAATVAPEGEPSGESAPAAEHDTTPSFVSSGNAPASDTSVGPGQPAAAPRPGDSSLPFTKLGHYEIVSRIGQGGMGDVYRGYERALDRSVAIKVLPAEMARSDDFVRRFKAEATAAAKLIHPNIIQIHLIGEDAGHHFFAMQYVEGESLADLLSRKGKLGTEETLAIVEQALSGLAAAHKQGLVHRDIKPGNILLDREHQRALLADFGLVKLLESSGTGRTATGVIMGTVDYISPEQGRGQPVDGRSDLYSFGVLLYRMLSGRLPFEAENATALIFQHVYEQPPALQEIAPHIPAPLVRVIDRLLQKSPADRHQTAEEVLADLRAFRSGRPVPSDEGQPSVEHRRHAIPGERRTAIIQAPIFDGVPQLPAGLAEIRPWTWWERTKDRAVSLFRRHAPEALQQLQNTQHQVDGAIAEYARRQRALQQLADEASGVLAELLSQSESQASAARHARERVAQCNDPEIARSAEAEELTAMRSADNLNRQAAEQQDQLDSIRLKLAQVTTTLETLQSQRDVLRARLSAARAERHLATGGTGRARQTWAVRLAALVLIPVVTVILIWQILKTPESSRSERLEPAVVQPAKAPVAPAPVGQNANPLEKSVAFKVEQAVPLRQLAGHRLPVRSVAFSPDGTSLASGSADGTVRLWGPETGEVVRTLEAHAGGVGAVAFSPDGTQLVTAGGTSQKDQRSLKLWDPATGREIRTLEGRMQHVQRIAFSPDGHTVAVGYNDGVPISLWDVSQGREVRTIEPPVEPIAVAFNPSGSLLALGGKDVNVRLWDVLHNEVALVLKGHSAVPVAVAFSADGSSLFSGDMGGVVLQWDVKSGKQIGSEIKATGQVKALSLSPNGRRLAVVARDQVSVWDLDVGSMRKVMASHRAVCATYRPNSGTLVTGGEDPFLTVWDARLEPLQLQKESSQFDLALPGEPLTVAFSTPPSKSGVFVGGKGFLGGFDYTSSLPFVTFGSVAEAITALDVAPNGYAVSGDDAGRIRVWSTNDARLIREFNVYDNAPRHISSRSQLRPIRSVCLAPVGWNVLIATAWSMFLYDVSNGLTVNLFKGVPEGLITVGISPTGEFAATGGRNEQEQMGDLRLWNLKTGQFVQRFLGHEKSVSAIAFSPDGRYLASGSVGVILLFDLKTGKEMRRLAYPENAASLPKSGINSLVFSPDGALLISGGAAISVWDVESGEELRRFGAAQPRSEDVIGAGATHDGRQIISLHRDRLIRQWPTIEWPKAANN